jgi:antitoxin CcdA
MHNAHVARASGTQRKTPTNLSVRTDLVKRARQLGLNLSGMLEAAIELAVLAAERETWLADNDQAIDAYNARVEAHGVFSDDWRTF